MEESNTQIAEIEGGGAARKNIPRRSLGKLFVKTFRTITGGLSGLLQSAWKFVCILSPVQFSADGSTNRSGFVRTSIFLILAVTSVAIFLGFAIVPGANSSRLDALERNLKTIQTRLESPGVSRTDFATPTTLLVAIQFVSAAAERSGPFDTALAVAISMAGKHPKVGPLLDELLAEATTGVPSRDDLRDDFQERMKKLREEGILDDFATSDGEGSFRLGEFLGLASAETSRENRTVIQQISAAVAKDNFAGAIKLLGKLDGRVRDSLESWRLKAGRRVAVDTVLTEIRRTAFIDIIEEAS